MYLSGVLELSVSSNIIQGVNFVIMKYQRICGQQKKYRTCIFHTFFLRFKYTNDLCLYKWLTQTFWKEFDLFGLPDAWANSFNFICCHFSLKKIRSTFNFTDLIFTVSCTTFPRHHYPSHSCSICAFLMDLFHFHTTD